MNTTLHNIECIIKRLVEFTVKSYCSDIEFDGSSKLLPLHELSAAKEIATHLGHEHDTVFYSPYKEVTAHMRPFYNVEELNHNNAEKINRIIFSNLEASGREVTIENSKKVISLNEYLNSSFGKDTIILFLVENEMYSISEYDNLNLLSEKLKEREPYATEKRKVDDERIKQGNVIAAVEMIPSIYGNEMQFNFGERNHYKWTDFRNSVSEIINNGGTENSAYKNTVTDDYWRYECCNTVIELFQQYAIKNLDDTYFIKSIISMLPQIFHIFKNIDDFEKYENNMEKVKEFKESLQWPEMIRI